MTTAATKNATTLRSTVTMKVSLKILPAKKHSSTRPFKQPFVAKLPSSCLVNISSSQHDNDQHQDHTAHQQRQQPMTTSAEQISIRSMQSCNKRRRYQRRGSKCQSMMVAAAVDSIRQTIAEYSTDYHRQKQQQRQDAVRGDSNMSDLVDEAIQVAAPTMVRP